MSDLQSWDRTTFDADGLTGEQLVLRDHNGFVVGTVIVWPGRATRVFWAGGRVSDYHGAGSRGCAIQDVEEGRRGGLIVARCSPRSTTAYRAS